MTEKGWIFLQLSLKASLSYGTITRGYIWNGRKWLCWIFHVLLGLALDLFVISFFKCFIFILIYFSVGELISPFLMHIFLSYFLSIRRFL